LNLAWVCELERAGGKKRKRVDGLDWRGIPQVDKVTTGGVILVRLEEEPVISNFLSLFSFGLFDCL
jgi:hypothetical protein